MKFNFKTSFCYILLFSSFFLILTSCESTLRSKNKISEWTKWVDANENFSNIEFSKNPNTDSSIKINGTQIWIGAQNLLNSSIQIPQDENLYFMFDVFAEGAAGSYSVLIDTDKGRYCMSSIPCKTNKWQTIIVRAKDMAAVNIKKQPSHPNGTRLFKVILCQRTTSGAEVNVGKHGDRLPEHSFYLKNFRMLSGAEGDAQAKGIVASLLPKNKYNGNMSFLLPSSNEITIWSAPSVVNVFRDTREPVKRKSKIEIEAAGGEWESFQVVLNSKTPSRCSVNISQLRHVSENFIIEEKNVDIYSVGYVPISISPEMLPVDWSCPDPLSRNPFTMLKAGDNQPFWVSVKIPEDARPGIYNGMINVTVGEETCKIPLEINVWNYKLPERFTFHTNLQVWGDLKTKLQIRDILARYKLYDGTAWLDCSEKEREAFLTKGLNTVKLTNAFGHGGVPASPEIFTQAWQNSLSNQINRKISFLQKSKIPLTDSFCYIWDEPHYNEIVIWQMKYISQLIKKVSPKIQTLAASVAYKNLYGYVDIFLSNYNKQLVQDYTEVKGSRPFKLWRGAAVPFVGDNPLNIALWGIENIKYGFDGYYAWGISAWEHKNLPNWSAWKDIGEYSISPLITLNGDGILLYPGGVLESTPDIPALSIRLEMIRDSIEDYERIKLLKELSIKCINQELRQEASKVLEEGYSMIQSFEQYNSNPELYYTFKHKIASIIMKMQDSEMNNKNFIKFNPEENSDLIH